MSTTSEINTQITQMAINGYGQKRGCLNHPILVSCPMNKTPWFVGFVLPLSPVPNVFKHLVSIHPSDQRTSPTTPSNHPKIYTSPSQLTSQFQDPAEKENGPPLKAVTSNAKPIDKDHQTYQTEGKSLGGSVQNLFESKNPTKQTEASINNRKKKPESFSVS